MHMSTHMSVRTAMHIPSQMAVHMALRMSVHLSIHAYGVADEEWIGLDWDTHMGVHMSARLSHTCL